MDSILEFFFDRINRIIRIFFVFINFWKKMMKNNPPSVERNISGYQNRLSKCFLV